MIEEALLEARALAHEHRLESKDLDELDELEDDEDEDFLNEYRQKRLNELSDLQARSIFGQVFPLQKPEYSEEVTEASKKAFVLVLLTSSSGTNEESRSMMEMWRQLATKFGDVKFCQMQADLCIEGYPDKNTPTILAYRDEEIKRQIVTLKELKGVKTELRDLEGLLLDLGAVKYGDTRLKSREDSKAAEDVGVKIGKSIRQSERNEDDEDSDWD